MPANTDSPQNSLNSSSLISLPTELLLEIIPYISFTPQNLQSLCLTCRRLQILVTHHERTLVSSIKTHQLRSRSLSLFPSLHTTTYAGLSTLHNRLRTLSALHAQWLHITSHGPELGWLSGRWEGIHKTGLLLLYRLQDAGSYPYKVALISGLPATSLACLAFKLISSIKILRVYGPDPIKGTFAAGDVMARSDIELAFEEMLLQHGPEFFIAMLNAGPRSKWAVSALETEIAGMIDRQSPCPDGTPKPPTLTSCMRRAFAARLNCHVSQTVSRMWEVLSCTSFDDISDEKLVAVVNGEEIKGGMKRIF